MEIIQIIYNEGLGFLRISQAWEILQAGEFSAFTTYDGIRAFIVPIIPLLLIFEFILGLTHKKPQAKVYKINFLIYVANRFIGRFISLGMIVLCIGLFEKYAPIQTTLTWYSVCLRLYRLGVWAFHLPLPWAQGSPVLVSALDPSCA